MTDCVCIGAQFCTRFQRHMASIHVRKCQAGGGDALEQMYANPVVIPERGQSRNQTAALPEVSDIGTRIRTAIETSADFKMQCGHLLSYLRTLNQRTTHDAAEIVSRILVELELPSACRTKIGSIENQRTWLTSIVAEVLR